MRWALLFSVGIGLGMVAAALLAAPIADAPALASAATRVTATSSTTEGTAAACTPAPLRRRAAQVLMVGLPGVMSADDALAEEVTALGVGGVFLNDSNVAYAEQVRALTAGLTDATKLPLLIATDEESGRVSTFRPLIGSTSAPRTLAATMSPEQVRVHAAQMGAGLADYGVTMDLAPVADLDDGVSSGLIGDRSFSAEPITAGEYAAAFAAGLSDAGVIPVVKHFPGHGRASGDVHKRPVAVGTAVDDLMTHDVQPFLGAIESGVPVVMTGHVTYDTIDPERPASLSPTMYALLRDLGFDGVAMTDSLGMGAVHRRWDFPEATVAALSAGADLVLATDGRQARAMRDAVVDAVADGMLTEERLNEAAARVLRLKGVDPEPLTCVR